MYSDDSTNGGIGEECPIYESLINDTSKVQIELNRIRVFNQGNLSESTKYNFKFFTFVYVSFIS